MLLWVNSNRPLLVWSFCFADLPHAHVVNLIPLKSRLSEPSAPTDRFIVEEALKVRDELDKLEEAFSQTKTPPAQFRDGLDGEGRCLRRFA